jgi:hypothetical protein
MFDRSNQVQITRRRKTQNLKFNSTQVITQSIYMLLLIFFLWDSDLSLTESTEFPMQFNYNRITISTKLEFKPFDMMVDQN